MVPVLDGCAGSGPVLVAEEWNVPQAILPGAGKTGPGSMTGSAAIDAESISRFEGEGGRLSGGTGTRKEPKEPALGNGRVPSKDKKVPVNPRLL